jgi:putative addiction module component (TIGR02574 family)
MFPALQALGIDRLSTVERLALVHEVWDSIAAETEKIPLSEAQQQEIDQRLAAHQTNPNAAIPWQQVETEALDRLQK